MPACEKCWSDAYDLSDHSGMEHLQCYYDLLRRRKDNPCSPKEQAGQWWDDKKQIDTRFKEEPTNED